MTDRMRIGAVAYLNARPLVYGLTQGLGAERLELSYAVPAVLAQQMARGELDIALLPIVELGATDGLEVVPGIGITTRGPAGSVLLLSRRPLEAVRSVALDPESRTSNALVRVLFAQVWHGRPRFEIGPVRLDEALDRFDAVVRIGDKALFERPPAVRVYDLGEAWTAAHDLPFVFAAWVARPGAVDREIYRLLHESRRRGVRAAGEIAEGYAWGGLRDPQLARRYLTRHIRYRLGAPEVEAMRRFLDACASLELIHRAVPIRFALARRTDCHEQAARRLSRSLG